VAEIKIELAPLMRRALIDGLAEMIPANLVEGVVIALLRRDATTRCILAEAIGEEGLRQNRLDQENDNTPGYVEKSWDEIALEMLDAIADTPGGRGEVG
jgi:hypothetical protein